MTKRIFYGNEHQRIKFSGETNDLKVVFNKDKTSVGFVTDFPVSAFDIEELVIYENIEQIPDNEVTNEISYPTWVVIKAED